MCTSKQSALVTVACQRTRSTLLPHLGLAVLVLAGCGDTVGGTDPGVPVDTTPPVVSSGQPSGMLAEGTIQATLRVTTDEAATCKWDVVAGTAYAAMAGTFTATGSTAHDTAVTGLVDSQLYTYYVRCQDGAGNATTSDYVVSFGVGTVTVQRPFPQHETYTTGTIKPSHRTQVELDAAVTIYYDAWKASYLASAPVTGYYVAFETPCSAALTVSEAHGYGMLVTVLMAGYDPDAQTLFDGLVAFYDRHRSSIDGDLMDWQVACNDAAGGDDDSASDGDMDIAYALILADRQWGSAGTIDYLGEAIRMITSGIKASLIRQDTIMLGDWDSDPDTSRTSDWMIGHLRAYGEVTGETAFWSGVVEQTYAYIAHLQQVHASTTGLLPDFVINARTDANPASAGFLEGAHDGHYYYNACRWPWRTAVEYAHYGDVRAKTALDQLIGWLRTTTSEDPANIRAGYQLNGTVIGNYETAAFSAPFGAGATVSSANQAYLNALWDRIVTMQEGYYEDTLNLLNMIYISGNWWKP